MAFTTFFSDIVSSFVPAVALAESEEVAQSPVVEEPVAQSPVVEEPVVEEPLVEEPVVDEPSVEEPAVEEPAVEEPVAEEPVAEEPVAEEPVVEEEEAAVEEDEEEEEEDEEEEEEAVDPYPALRQKAAETVCHSYKHHFDECVERVTKSQQDPNYEQLEYKEDCVEEFFHLEHCINDNTANALFSKLR